MKKLATFTVCMVVSFYGFAQVKTTHKPTNGMASTADHGKKIYTQYCLTCHQADGGGVQNMNPSLIGSDYVSGDKARIIKIVLDGFNENVAINGQTYTNTMPAFNTLKDKDVADVLTYIRSHFTNKASAVMPTEVTSIRGK